MEGFDVLATNVPCLKWRDVMFLHVFRGDVGVVLNACLIL